MSELDQKSSANAFFCELAAQCWGQKDSQQVIDEFSARSSEERQNFILCIKAMDRRLAEKYGDQEVFDGVPEDVPRSGALLFLYVWRRFFKANEIEVLKSLLTPHTSLDTAVGVIRDFYYRGAIATNVHRNGMPNNARTGYLGLIVDEVNKTITREGYHQLPRIDLSRSKKQWDAFTLIYGAGQLGITKERWLEWYSGDSEGNAPAQTKQRLNKKLNELGVSIEWVKEWLRLTVLGK